jgi:Dolichyl-phosphate-mannose-protein mannosyltransferase
MAKQNQFVLIALLALGLTLRSYHYLRAPSMWHDEAAVALNVLSKSYGQLLGPLTFHEAAPPLFLWMEKAVTAMFGDGVYALRLPPFLASCGSLLVLAWAAGRLLDARAVPWAVFLFAVSEQLSWHACEAKPYAFDVLAATLLLAVYAATQAGPLWRRLILFALPAPILIFFSYPACFLYGGVLAALAPAVCREKRLSGFAAYALLAGTVAGSFLLLLLGPVHAQHDAEMASCWTNAFPDWQRPWTVPAWTLFSTLDVFRYCCKPLGQLLVPLTVLGAVVLWRRRQRALVALLIVPILLALAASFAQRYPYGGARVLVYAAPALVLLIAAGTPAAWDWLRRYHPLAPAALAILFLPPLLAAGRAVIFSWPRADTAGAAAYVLAHRQRTDIVEGNDWTHQYYFRRLGSAFQPTAVTDAATGRCWIVYTEERPPTERLPAALSHGPPGWVAVERREFDFTTVLLLERRP